MAMEQKRKTTGQIYLDLAAKDHVDTYEAGEINNERMKKYHQEIIDGIEKTKKVIDGDFFVEIQFKREVLTPNVFQYKIFTRRTCPFPFYDQWVYRYRSNKDELELLWAMVDAISAHRYKEDPIHVADDEKECRNISLSFFDGTLTNIQADHNSELYRKGLDDKRRKSF